MAEIREPAGPAFKVVTVLTMLFFLAVVAALIRTNNTSSDVIATGPTVTAPVVATQAPAVVPVGAVATGGGGMAGDGPSTALPIFVALAAVSMLVAGGMVVRRRTA